MEKDLPIIELFVNNNFNVSAISLVEDPAIEVDFVAFSKEKVLTINFEQYSPVNIEQGILVGVAMIPNKMIYRNDQKNGEYYCFASENTVKQICHLYLQNNRQFNTKIHHNEEVSNVPVVESWIVEDPAKDKALVYGFEVPKGTWMVSMKLDNEVVRQGIKNGELKGISIEGNLLSKQLDKNEMEKIKKMLKLEKNEMKVALEQVKLKDGAILEAEKIEANNPAFLVAGENQVAVVDGNYETEDGSMIISVKDGIIQSVNEPQPAVEAPTESPAEVPAEVPGQPTMDEVITEQPVDDNTIIIEALAKQILEIKEMLAKILGEREQMNSELATIKEEFSKVLEQPAAASVKSEKVVNKLSKEELNKLNFEDAINLCRVSKVNKK